MFVEEIEPYYSDDPTTWVEDLSGGIKEVDVDKVTRGDAYISSLKEQYNDGVIRAVFDHDGWYKGHNFDYEFRSVVGNEEIVMIRITPEMDPGDGIIEGYLIQDIIDGELYAYVFVDEDWKQKVGESNILWGEDFENIQPFQYDAVSEGIYMNKIKDDKSRFSEDFSTSSGGVMVGNVGSDLDNIDANNSIMIRIS